MENVVSILHCIRSIALERVSEEAVAFSMRLLFVHKVIKSYNKADVTFRIILKVKF